MPHIQQLDTHVADLIAAGEVVERPASVVKELMENAIDAGAGALTVEISHGGMSLIRVTDDGCGIAREEVPTAFLRHATSKIRGERDLEAIGTLGFRGEALAAIAAVARIDILTRTPGAPLGCAMSLEGGVPGPVEDAGCPPGTTLVVRDLFFNTPARLKFMKKDSAEGAAVFAVVQRQALAHPEVSVKFIRDGKQELLTPGDGQLRSALYCVLGRDIALGMKEVSGSGEEVSVSGFASLPTCCRGTRGYQYFFVNGRPVKSAMLSAAVENAYANQKMVGKFPGCVLHITLRPNAVDVNVHPAKTEVKFGSERQVFDAVYYAVRSALEADRTRPSALGERPRPHDTVTPNQVTLSPSGGTITLSDPLRGGVTAPALDRDALRAQAARAAGTGSLARGIGEHRPGTPSPVHSAPRTVGNSAPLSRENPVSTPRSEQTFHRVGETAAGHGADRPAQDAVRSVSEPRRDEAPASLRPQTAVEPGEGASAAPRPAAGQEEHSAAQPPVPPTAEEPDAQPTPVQTDAAPDWRLIGEAFRTYAIVEQGETLLLIDKHAAHERLNFDAMRAQGYQPMVQLLLSPLTVTPPAEEGAALGANLPLLRRFGFDMDEFGGGSFIVRAVPSELDFGDIADTLSQLAGRLLLTGTADPDAARDELLHTMACKAAIKAGQRNDPAELKVLVDAVVSGRIKYCPHGRPVAVELTRGQLEKQFKRV